MQTSSDETARQVFHEFNRFMLLMWRLGLGKLINGWPEVGGQILVLTHTGRKTGQIHRTPVNYAICDGDIYVTAGFGSRSDWSANLRTNPKVEVWLPDGWWEGKAELVTAETERLERMRDVLIGSGFAASFAGIDPYTASDAELAEKTATYQLFRIRRTAPRTGPGGPGELSWVWPVATFLLLPLAFRRRRRRR